MPAAPHRHSQPPTRRGVCPTLRAPMQTGDGLLARLRPLDGVITPAQLQTIAALAAEFGNGQIEITARGNLQVRGLAPSTIAPFAAAVEAEIAIDTGLPVETSPLAGLDPTEIADPRPIATAIRHAAKTLHGQLAPKVTVIVDGDGAIPLDALAADIRLRIAAEGWSIFAGQNHLGIVSSAAAAPSAVTLLGLIAALGPEARGRELDPAIAKDRLAPHLTPGTPQQPPPSPPHQKITLTDTRIATRIGPPFGAASASALIALASAAQAAGITELRLAPQHALLALCANPAMAERIRADAAALGFLTTPTDPRRAISACIGSEGCASGLLPARRVAETLAQAEPDFFDGSFTLHVSGCAKGCAHPAPALLTLAANPTGTGLILDATASAPPQLTLPPNALPAAITRLANLWRDERALEESVGSCFKRLGAATIVARVRQGQS